MTAKKTQGKGEISRRELLAMASPLGKVSLSENRCTGCGLCIIECPTQALTTVCTGDTGNFQIHFRHSRCIACHQCVEICPEKCLVLERGTDLSKLNAPPEILFEDDIVYCAECGKPVGTRTMIAEVRTKVAVRPESDFELCPDCKTTQFSLTVR